MQSGNEQSVRRLFQDANQGGKYSAAKLFIALRYYGGNALHCAVGVSASTLLLFLADLFSHLIQQASRREIKCLSNFENGR